MATDAEIKAALSEKIDSYEAWCKTMDSLSLTHDYGMQMGMIPTCSYVEYSLGPQHRRPGRISHNSDARKHWWYAREAMRMHYKVYPEPTDVMRAVFNQYSLQQLHFAHMALDDPNFVAYTPTVDDGVRDRQIRTTFGKMLRKLFINFTDDEIQAFEAAHRSELDPTFLIATELDDIVHTYRNMDGDSGCMRYAPSHWDLLQNQHPASAYHAPGMGVAYTKVGEVIKSRAVIWVNPDNPDDKRFVRVYGDPALKRKLTMSGYVQRGLTGAKLKAVPTKRHGENMFVVPYLDGPGGDQTSNDGCWVFHPAGSEYLHIVDKNQADMLMAAGAQCARAKNTDVRTTLRPFDMSTLNVIDVFTNEPFSKLEHDVAYAYVDGKIMPFRDGSTLPPEYSGHLIYIYDNEAHTRRLLPCTAEVHDAGFPWAGMRLHRDVDTLRQFHIALLSPELGYERDAKADYSAVFRFTPPGGTTELVMLKSDAYRVLDLTGARYAHRSEADTLKKSRVYLALGEIDGYKTLVHKDHPDMVTTAGGKRAHKNLHKLVQLWDGRWEFARLCVRRTLWGQSVYLRVGESLPEPSTVLLDHVFKNRYERIVRDIVRANQAIEWTKLFTSRMNSGLGDVALRVTASGDLASTGWNAVSLDNIRQAFAKVKETTDEQLMDRFGEVEPLRVWQRHAEAALAYHDEKLATLIPTRTPAPAPAIPEPATADSLTRAIDTLLEARVVERV